VKLIWIKIKAPFFARRRLRLPRSVMKRLTQQLHHQNFQDWRLHWASPWHEPVSDIDTAAVDSLKVLDPKRPIREADMQVMAVKAILFDPIAKSHFPAL
jgi:hypothetical protein